jgi:NDP-sugar pyrophosphorylase family protein
MKVVLLAAGRSKRMQPIPDKNFLLFKGYSLIAHQLIQLKEAGFNDILIMGGAHNLEKLEILKECEKLNGMKIEVLEQKNLDEGMAGAIMDAEDAIGDSPICIVSSNDIVNIMAYELVREAAKSGDFESYIVGKKVEKYFPGGYLEVAEDGLIKSIIEKPGEGNEPSDLVNIVIHCHKNPKKLIEALRNVTSEKDDKYEVALDNLIKAGSKMKAVKFEGSWEPIKFPWHIFKFMKTMFKQIEGNISKDAQIANSAIINNKDKVIIEAGAKIFDNAVINGPCYIGKNVIVATNALVRDSIVNEGCVVGYSTEIARSYLGENVWTHTNYIGDSIISGNCSFGSGTVTGNLRLDEKNITVNIKGEKTCSGINKFGLITGENIRCGINTSFMPGIKIGSNCMIGAGLVIPQDIPENSFVKGKTELDIRENKADLASNAREEMMKKLK